jgi:hypothetical protein
MSTDLAIAAVTRTLVHFLEDEVKPKLGDTEPAAVGVTTGFTVISTMPHRVRDKLKTDNALNVFLYRSETNAAWRNQALPTQAKPGETAAPPLALDLEYLVIAYAEDDNEEIGHFFLARAMRALHEKPILARQRLAVQLAAARVHEQIEAIRITPRSLSIEELSKLWTVFQTQLRISAAYHVAVVLIDPKLPGRSPLPVLQRGANDSGVTAIAARPPWILEARPASGFPSVRWSGEDLRVTGDNLDTGALTARLDHLLFTKPRDLPVVPVDATAVRVPMPKVADAGVAAAWPAGRYSLALVVTRPSIPPFVTTQDVSFTVAPSIAVTPATATTPDDDTTFELTIEATPQVRPEQTNTVFVVWDGEQIAPTSVVTGGGADDPTTVKADVKGAAGMHRVRLRVDGVDSIPMKRTDDRFEFDRDQSVEVKRP